MNLWTISYLLVFCVFSFDTTLCFIHPQDNPVWPSGSYALPMASTGCPESKGFAWHTGHRLEELENDRNRNKQSTSMHLKTKVENPDITRYFCVKNSTETDEDRPKWPDGNYCIYKKGYLCPPGFHKGYVLWDDNNGKNASNRNSASGELPEGLYNQDTLIYFCCRATGSVAKRISLPVNRPFYLMAFESPTCQEVQDAVYTLEYIVFDTENTYNRDAKAYPYPYGAHLREPTINYCYYRECKWSFTQPSGSFSSPYFPQNYHNFQDCQWNITVPDDHVIRLQFDVFELESNPYSCGNSKCSCDYVEVKETSVTGNVTSLGRYCMTNVPSDAIVSSTNKMIVTFHSDLAISAKGFNVSYTTVLTMKRDTTQIVITNKERSTTMKTANTNTVVVSTKIPRKDVNQSSRILKPASREIMGLPLKYFIVVSVSLVVIVTGICCLAYKMSKKRNHPFMKRSQQRHPFQLLLYSSVRSSSGSSDPPVSLYGESELEGHFLEDQLIENPIYHKRNIKSDCTIMNEHQGKENDKSTCEERNMQNNCGTGEKQQCKESETKSACAESGTADILELSDNPLYESYDHSNREESRTENPLYEEHTSNNQVTSRELRDDK